MKAPFFNIRRLFGRHGAKDAAVKPAATPPASTPDNHPKNKRAGAGRTAAGKDPSRRRRRIFFATTLLLWLVLTGGLGGIVGWLLINGPDTVAKRAAARPQMSVAITLPGAKPANADTVKTKAPKEGGAVSTAADGQKPPGGVERGSLAGIDAALFERGQHGFLPRVAVDGRQPWQVYRRPVKIDGRPRIALLFTDMGLSPAESAAAVRDLPSHISLSFSTLAGGLPDQVAAARRDGHEVFLDLPMEPSDYPRSDPGPYTLLTDVSTVENLDRLEWVLAQVRGYVGVVTHMGGRFTADNESMMPVLEALKTRGLMFVDARASSRSLAIELATTLALPRAYGNTVIDAVPARADIERRLAALESRARSDGVAVGLARGYPVTLAVVKAWLRGAAARDFQLVPVSAVADAQRGG